MKRSNRNKKARTGIRLFPSPPSPIREKTRKVTVFPCSLPDMQEAITARYPTKNMTDPTAPINDIVDLAAVYSANDTGADQSSLATLLWKTFLAKNAEDMKATIKAVLRYDKAIAITEGGDSKSFDAVVLAALAELLVEGAIESMQNSPHFPTRKKPGKESGPDEVFAYTSAMLDYYSQGAAAVCGLVHAMALSKLVPVVSEETSSTPGTTRWFINQRFDTAELDSDATDID